MQAMHVLRLQCIDNSDKQKATVQLAEEPGHIHSGAAQVSIFESCLGTGSLCTYVLICNKRAHVLIYTNHSFSFAFLVGVYDNPPLVKHLHFYLETTFLKQQSVHSYIFIQLPENLLQHLKIITNAEIPFTTT